VGKLIWHVTMSLDGFIAGPDHAMQWAFEHGEQTPLGEEVRTTTGAVLGGRGWYDAAAAKYRGAAGIYGGDWSGSVFVLTSHPSDAPVDPLVTFLSAGLDDALARARAAAGEANVEVFGATLARQCLDAGELDEMVVHIAPVLLGDGVRLYGSPAAPTVALTRVAVHAGERTISARYAVPRS
jgi:dihydrofolate reductase